MAQRGSCGEQEKATLEPRRHEDTKRPSGGDTFASRHRRNDPIPLIPNNPRSAASAEFGASPTPFRIFVSSCVCGEKFIVIRALTPADLVPERHHPLRGGGGVRDGS